MTFDWESRFLRLSTLADRFLPPHLTDPEAVRQKRTTVLGALLGLLFSVGTGATYASMGSPWSASAIGLITVGLLLVPLLVYRGVSTAVIGHVMTALTAQAAVVVAARSGGLDSPAISWFFMLPIISYLASGYASSLLWAAVSLLSILGFFVAGRADVPFARDFAPEDIELLRASGYPGVIVSTALIMMMVESVRLTSLKERDVANRALERARLLRDMHDGVGGHLAGLIVRVQREQLHGVELVRGLEACLDDLRLVVDSLDPEARSVEVALGELRLRAFEQCRALNVELAWRTEGVEGLVLSGDHTLELLRASQELLSNAIRHAKAKRISFELERSTTPAALSLTVADDGVGFDPARPQRRGRGLQSLSARAATLRGVLRYERAEPGTRAQLVFPLAS